MVIAVSTAATVAIGCSDREHLGPCPPVFSYGVDVRVQNAETGEPICDAVVTARDGARSYTLVPPSAGSCRYIGVGRPGTYVVRAERGGFAPSAVSGVGVVGSDGECPYVRTIDIVMRLMPAR